MKNELLANFELCLALKGEKKSRWMSENYDTIPSLRESQIRQIYAIILTMGLFLILSAHLSKTCEQ